MANGHKLTGILGHAVHVRGLREDDLSAINKGVSITAENKPYVAVVEGEDMASSIVLAVDLRTDARVFEDKLVQPEALDAYERALHAAVQAITLESYGGEVN